MYPQTRAMLAGRGRELGDLEDALASAAAGRGQLVLLEGEPGIGKSRLADELAARARERGHVVLWGRSWEAAGAPPFWPWVQVLRAYLRAAPPERLRVEAGPGAVELAQLLPEMRSMFPDLPPLADTDSDSARFRLFDSTASLMRNAALTDPLVVVLDDLQSADTPSILLLRFLASQLGEMRLLVVGTYRDVEVTPGHPLFEALGELQREPVTRVVHLEGLDPAAVAQFIQATSERPATDDVVSSVWRATGGNPLFVGEVLKLLRAEGRLSEVVDPHSLRVALPAGVRAVIARRIGHLDAATGRVLELGAALGPEFALDVLRRVAGLEIDPSLDLVDQASQAGLLQQVVGVPGRYRFSHDLVRETLYEELPPGRRARLHLQIGQVLEELRGGPSGGHLAELAFHYVLAARHGAGASTGAGDDAWAATAGKAVEYAGLAGDQATRTLAYEEAARMYAMALSVLDLDPKPKDDVRADLLLALGEPKRERRTWMPPARPSSVPPTSRVARATAASSPGPRWDTAAASSGHGPAATCT